MQNHYEVPPESSKHGFSKINKGIKSLSEVVEKRGTLATVDGNLVQAWI